VDGGVILEDQKNVGRLERERSKLQRKKQVYFFLSGECGRGDEQKIIYAGASYKPRTPHGTKANTPVLATTTTKRPLAKVI